MSGNIDKLIAFNYFGGKFTWLEYLYDNFPCNFTHLVDLFAGSMAVSLNYKGKVIRTANEINEEITNFFKVLREHEDELIEQLELTPCSKAEFDEAYYPGIDRVDRARKFYVRVRQSFFGLGAQRQNKGFHMAKTQVNAAGGETVSRWNNAVPKLRDVAKEIRENFQILNLDYADCIDRIDNPHAFFYCDPPYPHECRSSNNDYLFEFSNEDHMALAQKLRNIEGKAMVSSYSCELMDDLYLSRGWEKVYFPPKLNNIRSTKVQEVIYINYIPQNTSLFKGY